MKWFKHDTDAATDAKLKRVKHRYGFEGYGLYFYCLERIGASLSVDNCTFALDEDAELIALEWRSDETRINEILNYMVKLELFTRDEFGRIVCKKMAHRIDKSMTSNPQMREIIEKIRAQLEAEEAEKQPKQAEIDMTPSEKPMTESCETMKGSEKPMQDKTRSDKTRSDDKFNVDDVFAEFWSKWPKKGDNRKPALTKFKSKCKSQKTADEIMSGLEKHLPELSSRENKYIPAASTWLNQERWRDDPPPTDSTGGFSGGGYGGVKGGM